jgi:tRNA threonylcarbamoyladenosine biosynthesis protein TsaB
MIVLLDTSSPTCRLTFVEDDWRYDDEWQADRELAKGLLGYLYSQMQKNGREWTDISGIGAFRGPGSFTGLRIGLTVLNTIADTNEVPIVGVSGDAWQEQAISRLRAGENERMILPLYSSDAHTTKPRK